MHGRFGLGDPNAFALVACEAAYNESEDWLDQVNEYIDGNFKFIEDYIENNNTENETGWRRRNVFGMDRYAWLQLVR